MIFQQIRNATVKIKYANKIILVDPWLVKKGSLRVIESPDETKNTIMNPTVELPLKLEEIVADVDVCIVTHNHIDHFDVDSMNHLKKDIKVYVQNNDDLQIISDLGFKDIELLRASGNHLNELVLYKTAGQHGETPELAEGPVSGVVFKHPQEKTLYLAGDTIWYDEIEKTIDKYKPEVIILNAGDARLKTGRLIMNLNDIKAVCDHACHTDIIVSHLEAVNHCFVSRADVRKFIIDNNLSNVHVPDDGQCYEF